MASLDDTWTISDISSSHGGSLRNSLTSADVKRQKIQKPIYSPISSIDSQSDSDEFQKPVKPFLKRTSGGYTAANPIQTVETNDAEKQENSQSIRDKPPTNIIPLPSYPKVKLEQEDETAKITDDLVPIIGPDLYSLAKSGVQNLAVSQNLRGYEIAPPKVTTHMDFMEYMKFHSRKKEYGMISDRPKVKKMEEEKKDIKIPETLYTYMAKASPQKKELDTEPIKKESQRNVIFPKQDITQRKKDVKVFGRRLDGNIDLKKQIEIQDHNEYAKKKETNKPQDKEDRISERSIEKISSFKNDIENAVKESELKLSSFQKMLEKLLQQKEKEYDNTLVKTANQVTNTVNNSMTRMGIDLKTFYKQFDKLQKVTSDITSRFGKQLSEDQKRSQTLMSKQMKQIEELGKKLEMIEKKTTQLKNDSRKENRIITQGITKNHRQPRRILFDLEAKTTELTIDEIHNEVSKKHPSIFKYPSWDDSSPTDNLDFYQKEQKFLIDELVGVSIEKSKSLDIGDILIEQPKFSMQFEDKVKIENLPPKPFVTSKADLSSADIIKLYPGFSENLLKFSVMNNKTVKVQQVKESAHPETIIPEKFTEPTTKMEAHSVQTDIPKEVSLHEVEIQTELTSEATIDILPNAYKELEEKIESYNVGWTTKDNSAMFFQNGIDVTVEKELSRFEKERLIREILPKKHFHQVPKLNECEDFDGICFTSHYSNRLIKTDDKIHTHMSNYVKGKRDLDSIFEEYANCLVERVIKHVSMSIIGEYLNCAVRQQETREEENATTETFTAIKGGALCADLFSFCYNNDISCDDEAIYNVTEELIIDFIKSKLPLVESHNSVQELVDIKSDEFDLESICELVFRLLLNDRFSEKGIVNDWKETEFVSIKTITSKDKEIILPNEKQLLKNVQPVKIENIISKGATIETQTEDSFCKIPPPIEDPTKLGLPHSTFFILSDNTVSDSKSPISIITETRPQQPQQYNICTQTTINEPPRLESTHSQTKEFQKSISGVQTEPPVTISTTTETNSKNLFVQYNQSSLFSIPPQIPPQKFTQSQNMQTSFSNPSNSKSISTQSSSSEEKVLTYSDTQSSYTSDEDHIYQPTDQQNFKEEYIELKRDKVFATLNENDIEKMLKIEMLKRAISGQKKEIQFEDFKNTSSNEISDSEEDSFLSSEPSLSTFYTSDSSNGFSYLLKRYDESDDYLNTSVSSYTDTIPFEKLTTSTITDSNYSTLGRYSLSESSTSNY